MSDSSMSFPEPKLFLELHIETSPNWARENRQAFAKLAQRQGIQFRPILLPRLRAGDPVPTSYTEDVNKAVAYWVRAPFLLDHPETREAMLSKLHAGSAWVILDFDRNYIQLQNEFLRPFGLEGTFVGAFRPPDGRPEHSRVVILDRDEHPAAFRDSLLFDGVKQLVVSGVHGLLHHGEAQSVLAIPDGVVELVDTSSDVFADWPVAELSCMAVWRPPRGRGGLLVLSANPEMDPMVTMFGDRVPGIEGGDNERFCRNLLRLIGELPSPSIFDWTEAYRLLSQIEANCYWITSHTLQRAFGADWWAAAVPEAIRQKCAARKLTEGGQYPDHAYLELMEYKKLWTRHWPLIVGAASTSEGPFPIEKKQAEDVFESIHPIRKKNAHPTKVAAIAQSRPSRSEREVLERAAQLILQAHRSVFGLVGVR